MINLTRKKWIALYAVCIGLFFLIVFQLSNIYPPLKVSILDIGQGDAILIQTPEYHNILIDAGPDNKIVDQLGKKMGFFDKTIDIFVMTHPHADHYKGILDVIQKYQIKKVILTGATSKDPAYLDFLNTIEAHHGTSLHFAQNNQDIQIGPNLYLDILFPFKDQSLIGHELKNQNNGSIVARLIRQTTNGQESLIILTGDAEYEEEREIDRKSVV